MPLGRGAISGYKRTLRRCSLSEAPLILLDLGGPPTEAHVRDYLRRLFSDPAMIPVPWGFRHLLARWISWRRAPHAAEKYRRIGGSPVPHEVEALRAEIEKHRDGPVLTAFRYAPPYIEEVGAALRAAGTQEVFALPLFPQFSTVTWGTCLRALQDTGLHVRVPNPYFAHPEWVARVCEAAYPLCRAETHLLLSAHGLPERTARHDPYVRQIQESAEIIAATLGLPYTLGYQSRLGRVRWTGPYLDDALRSLATSGVQDLVLVPISFVGENLETRWDLDHEALTLAAKLGIARAVRAPTPGLTAARFLARWAQ